MTALTLKAMREAVNVSKAELACRLQVSLNSYSRIEQAQKKPTIDTLHALAVIYGCSMDFIYHAYYRKGVEFIEALQEFCYSLRYGKDKDASYFARWVKTPKFENPAMYPETLDPGQILGEAG